MVFEKVDYVYWDEYENTALNKQRRMFLIKDTIFKDLHHSVFLQKN